MPSHQERRTPLPADYQFPTPQAKRTRKKREPRPMYHMTFFQKMLVNDQPTPDARAAKLQEFIDCGACTVTYQ